MADLVAPSDQTHAEHQSARHANDADNHPLHQKDGDDLPSAGTESLQHADFAGLLNGDGDEGVHNPECGHQNNEHQEEEHHVSLHGDRVEELLVHIHPGHAGEITGEHLPEILPQLGGTIGIGRPDGKAVDGSPEAVKLLTDVEGNEQKLTVVEITTALEDPGHRQLRWQDKLAQGLDVILLGGFG